MNKVFVVKITSGTNNGEFLCKWSKGYSTSKSIGLHNLYHSDAVAEREAKSYVKDIEDAARIVKEGLRREDTLAFCRLQALRGNTYKIIEFDLVEVPTNK